MSEYIEKDLVPTTDEGVALPPDTSNGCLGAECKARKDRLECLNTQHHLHSTAPSYENASDIAKEFRNLPVLTVWLKDCRHALHHERHEIEVPVPSIDVMQTVIEEEKILRRIVSSQHELKAIDRALAKPEVTVYQRRGLNRRRSIVMEKRPEEMGSLDQIVLIPEELVVGALLTAAPNHAKSRILMGADFAFTGTITKNELAIAKQHAGEALEARGALTLQTGIDRVQLVA